MDKTFLTVKELSLKLGVSEKTVYRMANSRSLPFAIKIGGQWRFNSEKIDKWIAETKEAPKNAIRQVTNPAIRIVDALDNGLIIYRAHGSNRDEVLDEILAMVGSLADDTVTAIKRQILYRESIVSSTLQGLSLMLPGSEISAGIEQSMLLLAFLDQPMELAAIDGSTTRAVLLLLAANKTERSLLKTRLTRLLMEPEFVKLIHSQPNRSDLLEQLTTIEQAVIPPGKKKATAEREK